LNTSQAAIARWESGGVKPTLESVERALRACALELRINLVPLDDHDTQLDREQHPLTPDQRLRQLENHVALVLETGVVLLAGGTGSDGSPLAGLEIYTP